MYLFTNMIGMTTPLTQELLSRGFEFYNKVDAYLNIITINLKKWILKRYNTFCTWWPILLRDFVVVVSLAFFPFENFSLILRRHLEWWRAANVDPCRALKLSVPHLLCHGASVYNDYLWLVTLTPVAERLAVELSLPFNTT